MRFERNYYLGQKRQKAPFPVAGFLAATISVLGIVCAGGWFVVNRQQDDAQIENTAPVTWTVKAPPATRP